MTSASQQYKPESVAGSAGKWISPLLLGVAMNLAWAGPAFSQQVIKWALATTTVSFAPAMLSAVAPEVFAKHGVRLELSDLRGNSNNCMAVMMTGSADVCHLGITSGMDAVAEGADLKAVALTTTPVTELTVSTKALRTLKVTVDSPIEDRLRALKGLRFVTSGPGTPNYVFLGAMLNKVGLSIRDLKFRTLVDTIAMIEGLRNDQIDGTMWSIGALGPALNDKSAVSLINLARGDVPEFRGAPFVVAYAQTAWVEKNADLIARAHAALGDAIVLLRSDKGKYSGLLKAKYAPDLNQALWDDAFQQSLPAMLDGAKTTRAGWNYILSLQVADSKRDYSKASFERMVMPFAQAK